MWELRYQRDGYQVDARVARGQTPPDWYMERPETENGLDFFIEAFWALSSCRSIGMSLGPIPWTAAYQYGLAHGLEHDMLILFPRIISRMDEAFLDWTAREMERKSKAKNPPQQAGQRTVERKR